MAELGVNIDHVATVRQARRTFEPDPVWAAALSELGGADCITLHLREDRRHIQERDLRILRQTVTVKLNLEMACEPQVLAIACEVKPHQATLVPERREEVTTEGGLDIAAPKAKGDRGHSPAGRRGHFRQSLPRSRSAATRRGRRLEGGRRGTSHRPICPGGPGRRQDEELEKLAQAGRFIRQAGMALHAGHGLTYHNVRPVAAMEGMHELNIGHSIVARALMVGFEQAVREMKRLVEG